MLVRRKKGVLLRRTPFLFLFKIELLRLGADQDPAAARAGQGPVLYKDQRVCEFLSGRGPLRVARLIWAKRPFCGFAY